MPQVIYLNSSLTTGRLGTEVRASHTTPTVSERADVVTALLIAGA
jgi:hypothetical protein